jgi:hypothetical protein
MVNHLKNTSIIHSVNNLTNVKLIHMSAYQFVELNQQSILNIDGCLTESANITIQQPDGRLAFYYFEDGKLTHSMVK